MQKRGSAVNSASGTNDPRHLDFVDALRGIAILGVLIVHTSLHVPDLSQGTVNVCLDGRFGVQLFFIISAFTLCLSCQQRSGMDRRPMAAFFVRRFFRIAPMYWGALAFYSTLAWARPGWILPRLTAGQVIGNFLFIHAWWPTWMNSAVPGGWTIGVEMSFYLILPLIVRWIDNLSKAIAFFAAALVAGVALSIPTHGLIQHAYGMHAGESVDRFTYAWLPSQLPVFALGIIFFFFWRIHQAQDSKQRQIALSPSPGTLGEGMRALARAGEGLTPPAQGSDPVPSKSALDNNPGRPSPHPSPGVPGEGECSRRAHALGNGTPALMAASLVIFFLVPSNRFPVPMGFLWQHIAFGIAFILLTIAALQRNRFLVNPFTRRLGVISFSAYLTHPFILAVCSDGLFDLRASGRLVLSPPVHFALLFAATLATTFATSSILHKRLESTGIRWGKRWIDRFGWGTARAARKDPAISPISEPDRPAMTLVA